MYILKGGHRLRAKSEKALALCLWQDLAVAIDRAGCGQRDRFGYSVIHLTNQWSRGAELVAVELGRKKKFVLVFLLYLKVQKLQPRCLKND